MVGLSFPDTFGDVSLGVLTEDAECFTCNKLCNSFKSQKCYSTRVGWLMGHIGQVAMTCSFTMSVLLYPVLSLSLSLSLSSLALLYRMKLMSCAILIKKERKVDQGKERKKQRSGR